MTAASAGATACIIGAGASGITSAQVLAARGIDFDWFEIGSEIGGNWRYDNDNGVSSAYRSLHINTSRQAMEYAAFPMPESLPDYPSHWQIADYFDSFVDHFGLRERVTFRTEVTRVVPEPGGGFEVTTRSREHGREPEIRHYDHVVVANGHHWDPRWPEPGFPGSENFPGKQLHAHYYRTPDLLEGQRVVVLGIGNSAADIAVESSRVARETYLAMRRGAHVVPKYVFGQPTDHLTDSPLARAPHRVQQLSDADDAPRRGRQDDRLRPARARPPRPRRPPDGQRRPAHPARPRRHHRQAVHRAVRGVDGVLHRRQRGRGRCRHLQHRLQDQLPVPRRSRRRADRQPGRALPAGGRPGPPRPLLRRADPAARAR